MISTTLKLAANWLNLLMTDFIRLILELRQCRALGFYFHNFKFSYLLYTTVHRKEKLLKKQIQYSSI